MFFSCAYPVPFSFMSIFRTASAAIAILVTFVLTGCGTSVPISPLKQVEPAGKPTGALREVSFASLPGWDADNLQEAWPALLASCSKLAKKPSWTKPCAAAGKISPVDVKSMRAFFERYFVPHQFIGADGSAEGLMTGYYEPLLRGARKRGGAFQTPIHRKPDDLLKIVPTSEHPDLKDLRLRGRLNGNQIVPYWSRGEIAQSNRMAGKEILWVDDPVDAFFLHVQGSGQVQLTDTRETVRLAYADQNGHPYKSIGRYLVDQGEISLDQASAQSIKAWFKANPERQQELLNANPSYIFFKEEKLTAPASGPKGALGVPLTGQRSVAVDPNFIALGTPVFISTTHPASNESMQRLTMAQDTGSAIKGANRIDYYWGFGTGSGEAAGKTKQRVSVWLLLPKNSS